MIDWLHTIRRQDNAVMSLLKGQAATTLRGASVALDVTEGHITHAESRDLINDIEHEGDESRNAVVQALSKAWATPLDREDLFRLSRSIDDVLDNLRDFVRETDMWNGDPGAYGRVALTHVIASLRGLELAVADEDHRQIRKHCLEASKEATRVRRSFESGLAVLYEEPLTVETLKTRDLLRRLDVIGLRLTEAADVMLDGLVKRAL